MCSMIQASLSFPDEYFERLSLLDQEISNANKREFVLTLIFEGLKAKNFPTPEEAKKTHSSGL